MFNVIESRGLAEKCTVLGLEACIIDRHTRLEDVYIVEPGGLSSLHQGINVCAYRLSELLLMTLD